MRVSATVSLLAGLLVLAGCAAPDEADAPAPRADEDAQTAAPAIDVDPAAGTSLEDAPRLIDVTAALRTSAAELVIPAGQYDLVRLAYDADLWGEKEPWDGDAEVVTACMEGEGVLMRAFGFDRPAFVEDQTIRPFVGFVPVGGDGWVMTMTQSSCSGDCDEVPRHDSAVLVGGLGNVTLRVGVLPSFDDDPETLWDRPAVEIGRDASTPEAFAGYAFRAMVLAEETTFVAGPLSAEWSDLAAPGVALERTATFHAALPVREPGIMSVGLASHETLGVDDWSYNLAAPARSGGWSGLWAHEPSGYSSFLTLSGATYPPRMSAQGNIGVGDLVFEASRTFTGASDPSGLASLSYDIVSVGHAGVDLDALFGWDTSQEPYPSSGGERMCGKTSALPDVLTCVGLPG